MCEVFLKQTLLTFQNFKMKKPVLIKALLFLFLIVTIISCKKTDNVANVMSNSSNNNPLFLESTGWKRVAIINSYNQVLSSANWMTPYDLNVSGVNLQLVYDQNNNTNQPTILKASYALGSNADAKITSLNKLYYISNGSNGVDFGVIFFRPETYNIETLVYPYYSGGAHITLHNEVGTELTQQFSSNFTDLFSSTKILSNGDILAGGLYSQNALELNFYTRASNTWRRILESASDTAYHIDYTPFRMDDGTVLAFRLFSKNKTKQAFLSISDFIRTATAPYQARFIEEHSEYAPTNVTINQFTPDVIEFASDVKIVNYAVEGNSFTVVLREKNKITNNYTLSAYKWTIGNLSFQKLYRGIAISKVLGDNLGRRDLVVCNIDGTIATLINEGINGNDLTYSLAIFNVNGEKRLGAVKNNTYPRAITKLSCLRYINGAYYAVASLSLFSATNGEGQHLDIVKLTP